MRVVVGKDLCEANAVCVGIAPELFHLGDGDEVEVTTDVVPPELESAARDAVWQCPKVALRIVD